MRNLRFQYTREDRLAAHWDINGIRKYLFPLLIKRQNGLCTICKKEILTRAEIHHTIYNPNVTLNELELLCVKCHKEGTDIRPFRMRCHPKMKDMLKEINDKGHFARLNGIRSNKGYTIVNGIKKRFSNSHELYLITNEI